MIIRKHFFSLSVALKYSYNLSEVFGDVIDTVWVEMGEGGIYSVVYKGCVCS